MIMANLGLVPPGQNLLGSFTGTPNRPSDVEFAVDSESVFEIAYVVLITSYGAFEAAALMIMADLGLVPPGQNLLVSFTGTPYSPSDIEFPIYSVSVFTTLFRS